MVHTLNAIRPSGGYVRRASGESATNESDVLMTLWPVAWGLAYLGAVFFVGTCVSVTRRPRSQPLGRSTVEQALNGQQFSRSSRQHRDSGIRRPLAEQSHASQSAAVETPSKD